MFAYAECAKCGCLQLVAPPADLSKYYGDNYYSFAAPGLALRVKALRTRYAITGKGLIGRMLYKRAPDERARTLRLVPLKGKILDVGCGSGQLVRELRSLGYNAVGIDPFVSESNEVVRKLSIFDLKDEKYELIMMHHSFEHMEDPAAVLRACKSALAPNGRILIHIPTADAYVWKHYRENWHGVDAPRHFFLHTVRSMEILAKGAGLVIEKTVFDSGGGQFWQCEQRVKGIAVKDHLPYRSAPISQEERDANEKRAHQLNAEGAGDQVCFVFACP